MNTSIMQNALGVSQQDCQNLRYEGNNLVLEIQTPKEKLCCPVCGSHNINRNGSHIRRFVSVLIGSEQDLSGHACTSYSMSRLRLYQTRKHRLCERETSPHKSLCKYGAWAVWLCYNPGHIMVSSGILGCSIQIEFLQLNYSNPDLSILRRISIDEFATHKGHVYKTIVVALPLNV